MQFKHTKLKPFRLEEMKEGYIGLVCYLIGEHQHREQFKADTGIDLSILNELKDKNEHNIIMGKFFDWVTKYHWGEAD